MQSPNRRTTGKYFLNYVSSTYKKLQSILRAYGCLIQNIPRERFFNMTLIRNGTGTRVTWYTNGTIYTLNIINILLLYRRRKYNYNFVGLLSSSPML